MTLIVVAPVAVLAVFISIVLVVRPILLVIVIVVAISVATEFLEGRVRRFAFFFVELAVAVLVETLHESGTSRLAAARMIAAMRRSTIARTIGASTRFAVTTLLTIPVAIVILLVILFGFAVFLVTLGTMPPMGVKRLACGIAFFVTQFAVAIFVHTAEHRLANLLARRPMVPAAVRRPARTTTGIVRAGTVVISIRECVVGTTRAVRRSEAMRPATVSKFAIPL